VRRHYMQAFDENLAAFFQPVRPGRYEGRDRRAGGRGRYGAPARGTPRLVVSDTLRNSRLMRPGLTAEASPREAVILMSLVNHPGLAENRFESLAGLEFGAPLTRKLLATLLELV